MREKLFCVEREEPIWGREGKEMVFGRGECGYGLWVATGSGFDWFFR
jgi:hypothetical protein